MGLQKLDAGLWILNSHFRALGCKASIRMTVMDTADGLLLHSPVALDGEDLASIRALGEVHAVIAPNLYHHFHFRPAASIFPTARRLIPEGLEWKIGLVPGAEILGLDTPLPPEIAHFTLGAHRYLKETLFFHRPSRTLVTADLLYNYHREQHLVERTSFRLLGCFGRPSVPFYHLFSIRNRAAVRAMLEWVREMNPRRIVMSHGRVVEGEDAPSLLAKAWARFT